MGDIDPDTLLEWLTMGTGEERDMQVIALEQLCMLLLMSDNVDRCFESCPPRSFLPALCQIFMDETAPDSILEVTARAITYYLDVSAECSRRIVTVDGAIKALCTRLVVVDITSRTSKDLAEQCVKVLELMCTREANAIYEAGGLNCMLTFIREYGTQIHKDTLHSAMSVVARLCSKMEPTDETLETCMDSLSKLVQHEDTYVADTALKCFACLADRFTRRGADPAPLAKHGLTDELLKKLVSSALACNLNTSSNLNASMSETRSSSGNVSIIVSVLSMLCRGSPSVTHDLLRSSLPNAIEIAMQGDERCVLDTMRLVDLLLILLFDGRDALPKSTLASKNGNLTTSRNKTTSSSGEKSHRQLIDCIRSKDTDGLIEAVVSSAFDVDFMDDVGQTLLNWASAFGTLEMVEFLCQKGADVNRGQRSSSLHYAACFGRPAVVKALLKHGANPELRDEDGKTPLDKARERNEEGHKEVVQILQSPGELLSVAVETVPDIDSETKESIKTGDIENKNDSIDDEKEGEANTIVNPQENIVKGDPEMALKYVKDLVPVFANTYQSSLLPSVKKATLSILKKMIHYIPASMMEELVTNKVAPQLVDVIAVALNCEDDDDARLSAFYCIQSLMSKSPEIFLIHFIRLGVLQRIIEMVHEFEDYLDESISNDDIIDGKLLKSKDNTDNSKEDATKILSGQPYHWHEWCIVRGRDCLYLWNDFCAIELSNGSNGWFRFVLDGKLATMYSSGSPEGGSSSSENRTEFLDKLQRARSTVPSNLESRKILSSSSAKKITVGNWTLNCLSGSELAIVNADGQQATILKEDLPGFLFESNRGTKHTFTAETLLGADFAYAWNGKPERKLRSKRDQTKQNLSTFARNLYCKYFKDVGLTPHGAMAKLNEISEVLNEHSQVQGVTEDSKVYRALEDLCSLLQEETMLSSYEIQTSGLVKSLNNLLNKNVTYKSVSKCTKEPGNTNEVFKKIFGGKFLNENSGKTTLTAVTLVQKLVMVLESSEKLPVITYEGLGGGCGLQILLRRLRFKLERGNKSASFLDRSGSYIKMEPLTTVGEVETYMLRTVGKQWFDYERETFKFIQLFKENNEILTFTYVSDFDENGIIYWIGTNGRTSGWKNPARHGIVHVMSSEGRSLPYGRLEDIISRDAQAENCHTNDEKSAWFAVDVGVYVIPSKYTLRHSRGYGSSALRNWLFQGSNDGTTWTTLKTHIHDESLNDPSSTASWDIPEEPIANETKGWHIFRIQQNGTNASGQTFYLSVSGFEIYGNVTSVLDKMEVMNHGDNINEKKRRRRVFRSQILRHIALGSKDDSDWKLMGDQTKGKSFLNEKKKAEDKGWVNVSWPNNNTDCKSNVENDFNFKVVDISDPEVQAAMLEVEKKEKNKNNKEKSQSTLDSALRQVVMSFAKQKTKTGKKETKSNDYQANKQNTNSESSLSEVCPNSRIDLANLQFLMAVEDLLDSPSSDLVANALAEAASMHVDQLRLATRSFRSSLRESTKGRSTPSGQGETESQSSPGKLQLEGFQESFQKPELLEEKSEPFEKDKDTSENIQEKSNTSDMNKRNEDNKDEAKELTKQECMTHIQKVITSSMSDVLESMHPGDDENDVHFDNFENDANEFDDDDFNENLSVAENNFLNGNQGVLEPNVISILNRAEAECCSSDDDDFNEHPDIHAGLINSENKDFNIDLVQTDNVPPLDTTSDAHKNEGDDKKMNDTEKTFRAVDNIIISSHALQACLKDNEAVIKDIILENQSNSNDLDIHETEKLQNELDSLKNEISTMRNEVEKIESCVERIESRVEEMSNDLETFQEETNELSEHISAEDGNMKSTSETESSRATNYMIVENINQNSINHLHEKNVNPTIVQKEIHTDNDMEQSTGEVDLSSNDGVASSPMLKTSDDLNFAVKNGDTNKIESSKKRKEDKGMFSLEEILEDLKLSDDDSKQKGSNKVQAAVDIIMDTESLDQESEKREDSRIEEAGDMEYAKNDQESIEDTDIDDGRYDCDADNDDMDDGEEDDEDEFNDIENEDESEAHDSYEPMNVEHERYYDHQRRIWDDDLILKCQHDALVPAFDPRPGRTNIQQTKDIEIPNAEQESEIQKNKLDGTVQLFIRGVPYPGGEEIEIQLDNPQSTIFSYVQTLVLHGMNGVCKSERLRRVWEPTYTIIYKSLAEESNDDGEIGRDSPTETDVIKWSVAYVKENLGSLRLPKSDLILYLQESCTSEFLKKWKLTGTAKSCRKQRNCNILISAYKEFAQMKMEYEVNKTPQHNGKSVQIEEQMHRSIDDITPIQQVLDILKALYKLNEEDTDINTIDDVEKILFNVANDEFLSKKLTNKLMQQIQDPLALASGSLPLWCEYLVINYPTLFPFEARQMFFRATAFGCSRSIVWLQNMQDVNLERSHGHPTRRLETTEFHIGRLKHERVTVPRGDNLFSTAVQLMNFHAERKAVLEIEFKDEEGTGLGPSLEFYALISLSIQRSDLMLWVSMDEIAEINEGQQAELLTKYSHHTNGLFPAPLPQDYEKMDEICQTFTFLGIFLAKSIQDNRLVDIPLSEPFFKMLCAGKGKYAKLSRTLSQTSEKAESNVFDKEDNSSPVADTAITTSLEHLDWHYFSDVLTENDFVLIYPHQAIFIEHLKMYISKRKEIMISNTYSEEEKQKKLEELMFVTTHGHECKLEDLCLTFQYVPSSTIYGFDAVDLKSGGSDEVLSGNNVEEYIELLIDFTMHKGIAKQLEAFRVGFNRVFPMEKLHAFKPDEVRLMLCGEQNPQWTYEELIAYTEPKYGYHKDSPGFLRLIKVLAAMNGPEKKAFLQFATGCSSLPPGGIANLHPRLTVVKKEDEGDTSYPSVNTCVHYLKLPEYSSEEVLKEKLLAATKEKGFHLN